MHTTVKEVLIIVSQWAGMCVCVRLAFYLWLRIPPPVFFYGGFSHKTKGVVKRALIESQIPIDLLFSCHIRLSYDDDLKKKEKMMFMQQTRQFCWAKHQRHYLAHTRQTKMERKE